jgi:flagellar protein FliO/FliZ
MDFADIARTIAALAVTLGLIGLAAAAARRYAPGALARLKPGAPRRLAIVESLVLDPARRLVLVRFDEQERLILLGEGRMLDTPPAAPPSPARRSRKTAP